MKKDIFIDNNIAKNFSSPVDNEYKKLIKWLTHYDDEKPQKNAHIVVSQKLINEYSRSSVNAKSLTNITVILSIMQKQGRRIFITNQKIKDFQNKHFTKSILKKLKSNIEDREHIPVVLLSERKYVLSLDENFTYDLHQFPKFIVRVEKRPENLPYNL
ncbi:MAG: hypothetical protein A2033_00265 [Bacteroidetes bacterium GWA2_31_9]|nr:MAG: hypothetical protein A2033_00265 [Bacteroidetes bacterium GWA2_31_9]